MVTSKRPHHPIARPDRPSGFTLVEVLVALAILAIALAAVLRSMGQAIDLSVGLRDRTLAMWVAQERAAERQLRQGLSIGKSEGTLEFGGQKWRWREQVTNYPIEPELRQIDIEVSAEKSSHTLAHLTFVLRPR